MLSYSLNPHVFDDLRSEGAAYWLGFLFADGGVNKTTLNLILGAKDADQVAAFLAFMECDKPVRIAERTNQTGKNFPVAIASVSNRHLADRLRALGVEPFRPRGLVTLGAVPATYRHHFMRGWFDGDGSALRTPQLSFIGAPDFIEAVARIFEQKTGANPIVRRQLKRSRKVATLTYRGVHRCGAIAAYLYRDATVWLPRKRARIDAWPAPVRAKADRFCPQCGHQL